MAGLMLCCADERFGSVTSEPLYVIATLCDPRYRCRLFDAGKLQTVKSWLVEEARKAGDAMAATSSPPAKQPRLSTPNSRQTLVLGVLSGLLASSSCQTPSSIAETEVERYLAQDPVPTTTCPLDWWRENQSLFPLVAHVARRYLSAPPTSVASERLFSAAGLVYTDRRNRLAPKRADMLLFLKHNLPLINYKY